MATASDVLRVARGELGYSRWNDPQAGTKYGRWYAEQTGQSYYGRSGVPYCAMFVSWVFAQAGATCAGIPGAYTPTMLNAAKKAGKVVSTRSAQPGDVVYFNWDGGVVDHVGIVEANKGSYIQTIEGNTSNGQVKRRTRAWGVVAGIVRPNYGGSSASGSGSTSSSSGLGDLRYWGPKFTREMQRQRGTIVDGIVSNQPTSNKKWLPNADTASWQFKSRVNGSSAMVKSLQRLIGAGVDGWFGCESVGKLQQWLRNKGYNIAVDHYMGPATCTAVGQALQRGLFK